MSYLCQSSLGTSEPFSKVTGKPSSFLNLLSCFIIPQSWTDDAIFFFLTWVPNGVASFPLLFVEKEYLFLKSLCEQIGQIYA